MSDADWLYFIHVSHENRLTDLTEWPSKHKLKQNNAELHSVSRSKLLVSNFLVLFKLMAPLLFKIMIV